MKHSMQLNTARSLTAMWLMAAIVATALPAMAQTPNQPWQAGSSIVIPEGRSIMLHFHNMRRVQIANPDIADVVVSSMAQLAVYGKTRGLTTLYVWDLNGLHEYEVTVTGLTPAEKAGRELQKALGGKLAYTTVGDSFLVVEGSLEDPALVQRAHRIIAAQSGPVAIMDMIRASGEVQVSAAEAAAAAFRRIFDGKLEYLVLAPDKLVIQGDLSDAKQVEQVAGVVAATRSEQLGIVNLVKYNDDLASPPLDVIRQAIGDELKVWQVKGRTVAVDGTLSADEDYQRLGKILESFADRANIINLVRVIKPRPDIAAYAEQLREAFGPTVEIKQMGPETLGLQGTVISEAEAKYYQDALAAEQHPYHIVNFLRIVEPYADQIEVAVIVAEINRDDLDRIGVEWGRLGPDDVITMLDKPILFQVGTESGTKRIYPIGAGADAIRQNVKGRLLASPRVMVNDGDEAEILVGGEVPIPVVSPGESGVTSISIEYRPYGIKLLITPTIRADGKTLDLEIEPEVSSLDWANALDISGFRIPALRTRRVTTNVSLADGNTLALGGLLQREQVETVSKIPVLSEIPIIGELFKHKEFTNGDTELVILVTPRIMTGTHHPPGYRHPVDEELQHMRRIPE